MRISREEFGHFERFLDLSSVRGLKALASGNVSPMLLPPFAFLLSVAFLLGSPSTSAAESYDWMYEPTEIVDISFSLTEQARQDLESDPGEYVPAQFEISGSKDRNFGPVTVSFRLKGSVGGSFRTLAGKAAFKVKFPTGSRPLGLKKMTLNNMVQDPSKIREALA